MIKRTLIAIAVVALLATSVQAVGPEPHSKKGLDDDGNMQLGFGDIKVNNQKLTIGWPVEYKAIDLCIIPVLMNVGYFVQVDECHKRKIKLIQVDCADVGKETKHWPCYLDCEDIKIRANFEAKLGTDLKLNESGKDVIDGHWKAYYQDGDIVDSSGDWNTVTVCVKAWEAKLYKNSPGEEINVGTLTITIKPNA